ncbi:MAG: NAD(P)-dependent oxidoreductase [Candidatus Lokiarchaeota archaeon]|nr:NAD(P)-dependent oxidoreductase [Candidatus Harpocratesius repetitus]
MARQIGWIGLGATGKTLASHLIKAGHEVAIFNRTIEKCNDLVDIGGKVCLSPQEVAEKSTIIFTMLGFPDDVRQVYFGKNGQGGLLNGVREGTILIDMTTSEPALAREIYTAAQKKGAHALDAPISGPDLAARNKQLAIMVGGDEEIFDEIYPLFKTFAEDITYMGETGSGQSAKISNQILIANTMIGVVEALQFAYKQGLDLKKTIEIMGKGTGASWSVRNLGKRMVDGRFDSGFFIKHFVKDMAIALKEAERMHLALPGLSLAHQFYLVAMNLGLENKGTQAIYQVFETLNNIPLK